MSDRSPAVITLNTGILAAPHSPARPPTDRAERARRRVSALLGHQVMAEEEEMERRERLPKCEQPLRTLDVKRLTVLYPGRKAIGSLFPGFR